MKKIYLFYLTVFSLSVLTFSQAYSEETYLSAEREFIEGTDRDYGEPRRFLACDGAEGKPHSNGAGFVATTATVSETAYIDEHAQACGNPKAHDDDENVGTTNAKRAASLIIWGSLFF